MIETLFDQEVVFILIFEKNFLLTQRVKKNLSNFYHFIIFNLLTKKKIL